MISTLLSSSALAVLLNTSPAPMADIFVDAAGANCATGTGTAIDPVCSIAAAIGLAAPGDTIRIEPGTYVENVVISFDLDLISTGGADVTSIDGNAAGSVVSVSSPVTVLIDGLTLTNGAAPFGAGLFATDSSVTIMNSTLSGNSTGGSGGGVFFSGTLPTDSLTITNSTIADNVAAAGGYGGGVYTSGAGSTLITASTLSGNSSSYGGGIHASGESLVIVNSTFSGNTADYGGGVYVLGGTVSISHATITGNSGYYGGGVYNISGSNVVDVANSIIAGNTAAYYADCFGPFVSQGFNVVGEGGNGFTNGVMGDQAGTNGSAVDALLGPLQDNGGATQTHAPLAGSPAIDAANPVMFEAIDQRGISRPLGAGPDVGAVEGSASTAVAFCFGDGSGAACPCANSSSAGHLGGCANSAGDGAVLTAMGNASLASDSLNLDLSSASLNSFALLVSGNNRLPQVGGCVGCGIPAFDGLRCAGGGFLRHGSRSTDSMGETGNGWGPPGGPIGGLIAANGFVAGQTRHFFAFYRDDTAQICQTGQNSSNGQSITFQP